MENLKKLTDIQLIGKYKALEGYACDVFKDTLLVDFEETDIYGEMMCIQSEANERGIYLTR